MSRIDSLKANEIIDIAKQALQDELDALSFVKEQINGEFVSAVEILNAANKVIVSGVGKSGIIARKIAATFSSVGIPAVYMNPVEALHGDIGIVQENDAVILLSKSGASEEVVKLVPFLLKRNIKIISILGSRNSFLAANSDCAIIGAVEKEACPLNLAPTSSAVTAMALGDALAIAIMNIRNFSLKEFSENHPMGQLGRNITIQVYEAMHKGNDIPVVSPENTFKETIIEISAKGLGCAVVVDSGGKLLGLITDGDARRALQDYDDIRNLNAGRIMTKSPVTAKPDMYLGEALSIMENRKSQINVLPVVDGNNLLIGVLRLHDIIRTGL